MNEDDYNDDLERDDLDLSSVKLHYANVVQDEEEEEQLDASSLAPPTNMAIEEQSKIVINADSVLLKKSLMSDALDALLGGGRSAGEALGESALLVPSRQEAGFSATIERNIHLNNNHNSGNSKNSNDNDDDDADDDDDDADDKMRNGGASSVTLEKHVERAFFVRQGHAASRSNDDTPLDGPEPPLNDRLEREASDVFYDEFEDDANDAWRIKRHAAPGQTKLVTDAVLSCPACFTPVCYSSTLSGGVQYRAERVVNCLVVKHEIAAPLPGASRHEQYHPVKCGVCSTELGVRDSANIYHLFHILPGY
jgi:hypothetical protein